MRLRRSTLPATGALVVLVAAWTFGAIAYPHFASWLVARNLMVDQAVLGIAAVGATFVILSGGIDLSVGSVLAFTGVLVATLIERAGWHPLPAMAAGLAAGAAFGAAQGLLIRLLDIPAFLITLAGMFLAQGAAFAITPRSLGIHHPFFGRIVHDALVVRLPLGPRGISIPPTVIIMLLVFAAAWWMLTQLRFGRRVYAIGDDAHAATLLGTPVGRVTVGVYALSGLCSALAGVVLLANQESGDPAACRGFELDAIAAVVIGGTLLRGGAGTVLGTFCGVMILGLIQTIIAFQGDLNSWWTRIAIEALMLAFLLLQRGLEHFAPHREP